MRQTLTIEDLCRALRVHPETIRRWVAQGEFPQPLALPGRVKRWDADEINQFIQTASDENAAAESR